MNNQLTDRRAIKVLIGNLLVRSARMVFQVFLNVFIWKETQDVQLVALFNIVYLLSHTTSFSLIAPRVKRGHRNLLHRISMLGYTLVYLGVVLLGAQAINHVLWIAAGIGIFNGIYRITYHNNQFDLTTFHNRGNYEGLKQSFQMLAKIITPSVVGLIIGINYQGLGYEMAFGFGAILFFIAAWVGSVELEKTQTTKFSLKKAFGKIKKYKDTFRSVYTYALTGFSFSNSLIEVIIPLLLFSFVPSESSLGFLISGFAVLSIISSYLFGKFVAYKNYRLAILYSGVLYALAVGGVVLFPVYRYMIVFSAVINFIALFFSIPQKVISDNVLHHIPNYKHMRPEYMVIREWFLTIGWISSFACIYLLNSLEIAVVRYVFFAMVVLIFIATYFLSTIRLEKIQKY